MGGISSLGAGSGLDLNSLVTLLLRAERSPTESRLNRTQARAETQLSALGRLNGGLGELTSKVSALDNLEVSRRATSSTSATVGVRSTGSPETGSYRVQVSQLATAQSLASATFADAEDPVGGGTLSLSQGDQTVTLDLAEGSSLRDVRDAINGSAADIQAVIVRDGDSSRLLLTSSLTGGAGEMTVTLDGGLDARLASAAMTETAAAADAQFSVNGLALTASSNQVDDVVPGLEFDLKRTTDGAEAVTITVAQDRAGVRSKLEAVVTAYNALVDTLGALGRADPEGGRSGPLVGDSTLRAIQSRLGGAFMAPIEGAEADGPARMLDLGLSVDVTGKVSFESATLDDALAADEAGVAALVSGFASRFGGILEGFSGAGGSIAARTEGLNAQLSRVSDQRQALDLRMARVEQRLRSQFTALDATLTRFQNTSEFLGTQLASLDNLRPR